MPRYKTPKLAKTTARGYGNTHQKARAQAFKLLPEHSPCSRCGQPMWKWAKDKHGRSALHYDHNDDRTGYLGFSHAHCNIAAGSTPHTTQHTPQDHKTTTATWQSRTW